MFFVGILRKDTPGEIFLTLLMVVALELLLVYLVRFALRYGNFWGFFIPMAAGLGFLLLAVLRFLFYDYLLHPHRLKMVAILGGILAGIYLLSLAISRLCRRFPKATAGALIVSLFIYILYVRLGNPRPVLEITPGLPKKEWPNILIIIGDTLRPDHLGCYGYPYPTSPNIDALAAEGALYENCTAQSSWSLPSHTSLFTGLYYSQHQTTFTNPFLDSRFVTLAQVLEAIGYQTASFCANPWVGPQSGLLRGFNYTYTGFSSSEFIIFHHLKKIPWLADLLKLREPLDDRDILKNIRKWFQRKYQPGKPVFIFANFFPSHLPYLPPEPFRSRFIKQRFTQVDQQLVRLIAGFVAGEALSQEILKDAQKMEMLYALYDGEVAFTDALIGEVFAELRARNLWRNTLVIFTSDHGDSLGEHGFFSHGNCLYEPLIHVPLIIRLPGVFPQGVKIASPVQHIDVFTTILGILKINPASLETKEVKYQGVDLRHLEDSPRLIASELAYIQPSVPIPSTWAAGQPSAIKAIKWDDYKYLRYDNGYEELFDLATDPREERNLVSSKPELVNQFRKRLLEWQKSMAGIKVKTRSLEELDKQTLERLRALGYIQ